MNRETVIKELKKFTKDEIIEICIKATFENYTLCDCIKIMQIEKEYIKENTLSKKIDNLLNEISKLQSKLANTTDDEKIWELYEYLTNKKVELNRTINKYCNLHKSKTKELRWYYGIEWRC